jgi:ribosome-associated toxin RatA of RatAB toxin-antitoxin module
MFLRTLLRTGVVLAGGVALAASCSRESVDWSQPENLLLREKAEQVDDGMHLEYWTLVDASCRAIFAALRDVEHYPDFVDGVDRVALLDEQGDVKTAEVTQRVIGRQQNATVRWTFSPNDLGIRFETLKSDLSRNQGTYEMQPSPDGKRCLVHSSFVVREGEAAKSVPIGVIASATRDSYVAAARGVKQRAEGGAAPR